jgi:peptidyl-prolyl cis-trans isomerase D
MLSIIRENVKSWFFKVILLVIVVVFIFWGFGAYKEGVRNVIAKVNDEEITRKEFLKEYENLTNYYQNIYKDKWSKNIVDSLNLKEEAIENLINKKVIIDKAKKLGFKISKKELQAIIQSYPAFQKNNRFDKSLYFQLLGNKSKDFEDGQYKLLFFSKINDFISQTIKVSFKEVKDYYDFLNESVNLEFLKISKSVIKKEDIKVSLDDYKKYYEKNKENFKTPIKYKVKYIFLKSKDYISQIEISDTEAMDYYIISQEKFIEKDKFKLRHILLKLKEGDGQKDENSILKKAKKITDELEKGEDFAKLARKYSEDEATAEKGGDLGLVDIENLSKQVVEKIGSLEEGDVSDPIKTKNGYQIIQLIEKKSEKLIPFEEVKEEIKKMILKEEGEEKAHNLVKRKARRILREVKINKDIEKVGKIENMEIKETKYFGEKDNPQFYAVCKNMNIGEIGPLVETDNLIHIIELLDKKDSYLPKFEEVKENVLEKVREQKTKDLLKKKAEGMLAKLKAGEDIAESLKKYGLNFKETGLFKPAIVAYVPKIGISDKIKYGILNLTRENPYLDEIEKVGDNYYIIRLKERKAPEVKELEEKLDIWKNNLSGIKKKLVYENWLGDIKSNYIIERKPL